MTARTNAVVGPGAVNQDRWLAGPVFGLGVLDARLHGGDIVRLWTIPVSVSLDGSGHQSGQRDASGMMSTEVAGSLERVFQEVAEPPMT